MKILSMSLNTGVCGVAVQVALLDNDSCTWSFILKAKLLPLVYREHSNYWKLLFKILSWTSSVSLLNSFSVYNFQKYFQN